MTVFYLPHLSSVYFLAPVHQYMWQITYHLLLQLWIVNKSSQRYFTLPLCVSNLLYQLLALRYPASPLLSIHLNLKNKYLWIHFINIFLLKQHIRKHCKNWFFKITLWDHVAIKFLRSCLWLDKKCGKATVDPVNPWSSLVSCILCVEIYK